MWEKEVWKKYIGRGEKGKKHGSVEKGKNIFKWKCSWIVLSPSDEEIREKESLNCSIQPTFVY